MRILILILGLCMPLLSVAQQPVKQIENYVRATVEHVAPDVERNFGGILRILQIVELQLLDGNDAGTSISIENGVLNNREDMRLHEGETIVMQRVISPNGEVDYLVREKYRLPALFWLLVFFFTLGIVLGGRIGFTSVLGLGVSIAILLYFVVPQIIAGGNPLLISLSGAVLIACTALYLAHGFNRRTTIALCSTILTLAISTILAVVFVYMCKLFGMGTEESVFLQLGPLQQVNLRGLLLGGIIIGALGVLDDITTSQTAAIDELSKANHKLGYKELYNAGVSIGREHIASLINTLALAYVGASLPLLLLFSMNTDSPWWVILNSEFLAEEIVRTFVGSCTLLIAVPISTWMAARAFAHGNHTNATGHACVH